MDTCANGHLRTPENVSDAPSIRGKCRVCLRERVARSRARRTSEEEKRAAEVQDVRDSLEELGLDPTRHVRFERMAELAGRVSRLDSVVQIDSSFLNVAVANSVRLEYKEYRERYPEVAEVLDRLGSLDELLTPPEETRCRNGHVRSEENTFVKPSGERRCRVCQRERVRRYRESMG